MVPLMCDLEPMWDGVLRTFDFLHRFYSCFPLSSNYYFSLDFRYCQSSQVTYYVGIVGIVHSLDVLCYYSDHCVQCTSWWVKSDCSGMHGLQDFVWWEI